MDLILPHRLAFSKAGTVARPISSREQIEPDSTYRPHLVIPAKAGIHCSRVRAVEKWAPTCVGATTIGAKLIWQNFEIRTLALPVSSDAGSSFAKSGSISAGSRRSAGGAAPPRSCGDRSGIATAKASLSAGRCAGRRRLRQDRRASAWHTSHRASCATAAFCPGGCRLSWLFDLRVAPLADTVIGIAGDVAADGEDSRSSDLP
jgi:hypothetical protein